MTQADWPAAAQYWAQLRALEPNDRSAYSEGAKSLVQSGRLDEADALYAETIARFADDADCCEAGAQLAERINKWDAAADRWSALLDRDPDRADAYVPAARVLERVGRFDRIADLFERGSKAFPERGDIACEPVWIACRRGDFTNAQAWFDRARARLPNNGSVYHVGAYMFEWQQRFDEAEAMLGTGLLHCPGDESQAVHRLQIATFRLEREPEIAERTLGYLAAIRQDFPNCVQGHALGIRLYARLGRHAEAEDIARTFLSRWPDHPEVLLEYARAAETRGEAVEALARFRQLNLAHPMRLEGYLDFARLSAGNGNPAAAEDALREAMDKLHWISRPFLEYATLAGRLGNWQVAVERWEDAQRRFPGDAEIRQGLNGAQLGLLSVADASIRVAGASSRTEAAELMMHFESLGGGDNQGCEFGLVQRALGAEPLGLLRWTSVEPDDLIAALDAQFAGIGDPEQTITEIQGDGKHGEYFVIDTKYRTLNHSGVAPSEMAGDRVGEFLKRRFKYLANKLIADLEDGHKIFVYRKITRDLTDDEIARLHSAIRRYGEATLLYVRYADEAHANGTVECPAPGLSIGYIDRFAFDRSLNRGALPTTSWLTLCRNAHRLWQESRTPVDS